MAYLDNRVVTVDAILTKKGRELLARGDGSFKITQFALADDEVDYTLYNPTHPSGSVFAGEAIENMPVLEAFPDETQIMKYKLTTLPRGTARLPILSVGAGSFTLRQGSTVKINPETLNYTGKTSVIETVGYSATVGDSRVARITGAGVDTDEARRLNDIAAQNVTVGTNMSQTVIGTVFTLQATTVNVLFGEKTSLQTTLTFVGRGSGARITVPLIVTRNSN